MKIGFLTDIHARATRPSCRLDENYIESWSNDVENAIKELSDCGIILIGGDIFNKPEEKCIALSQIIRIFSPYKDKLYTVIGNHDIFGYEKKGIGGTALEVLLFSGIVKKLDKILIGDILIKGIHAYDKELDFKKEPGHKITIVVAHKMISPSGAFDGIKIKDLDIDGNADIILSGDIHDPHLVKTNKRIFINPGSLSRQNILDKDRFPAVAVIEILNNKLNYYIKQINSVGKEMFNINDYESTKNKKEDLIEFASRYSSEIKSIRSSSIDLKQQLRSFLEKNNIEKDISKLIEEYLIKNEKD